MKRGLAFLDCGAFPPLSFCDPKQGGGKAPQSKGTPYFLSTKRHYFQNSVRVGFPER
jgi:hypothetical protein